jgi:hypothetical protein
MAPYTRSAHKRQTQTIGKVYTPIFKLKKESPLRQYLNRHAPGQLTEIFKLSTLLTILKNIIIETHQFDENNPQILIFDDELKTFLDIPAIHYDQLYEYVHKHLKHVITLQPRLTHTNTFAFNMYPNEPKPKKLCPNIPKEKSQYIILSTSPEINPIVPSIEKTCFAQADDLCVMRRKLRQVLIFLPSFPSHEFIFTFQDIQKYVTEYVMIRKDYFVDPRNPLIFVIKNDPLSVALNVKGFYISQLESLIRLSVTVLKF